MKKLKGFKRTKVGVFRMLEKWKQSSPEPLPEFLQQAFKIKRKRKAKA